MLCCVLVFLWSFNQHYKDVVKKWKCWFAQSISRLKKFDINTIFFFIDLWSSPYFNLYLKMSIKIVHQMHDLIGKKTDRNHYRWKKMTKYLPDQFRYLGIMYYYLFCGIRYFFMNATTVTKTVRRFRNIISREV